MESIAPLEYCAVRYLELYVKTDKELIESFKQKITGENTRLLLKKYKVSRSFAGLSEQGVAEGIAKEVNRMISTKKDPATRVLGLASKLEKQFGRNTVSAASKLLWAADPEGVAIYDALAFNALSSNNDSLKPRDYASFLDAWNEEYLNVKPRIEVAVSALSKLPQNFTAAFAMSPKEYKKTISSEAFARRVYDQMLWLKG